MEGFDKNEEVDKIELLQKRCSAIL